MTATILSVLAWGVLGLLAVIGGLAAYGWVLCWWESRDFRWPR